MFSDKNKKHISCVSVDCSTEIKRIKYNKLPFLKPLPSLQVTMQFSVALDTVKIGLKIRRIATNWMYREKLKPCLVLLLQSKLIPFISSIEFCYSLDLKSFVM